MARPDLQPEGDREESICSVISSDDQELLYEVRNEEEVFDPPETKILPSNTQQQKSLQMTLLVSFQQFIPMYEILYLT